MAYKAWLPSDALLDGVLETELFDIFNIWQEKWFGDRLKGDFEFTAAPPYEDMPPIEMGLHFSGENFELAISLHTGGIREISTSMLGSKTPTKLAKHDKIFMRDLVWYCLEDLQNAINRAFTISSDVSVSVTEGPVETSSNYSHRVGINLASNSSLMSVELQEDYLIRARKRFAIKDVENISLTPRLDALQDQSIEIGLYAGSGEIMLSELEKLSQGDVLILDRDVGQTMELTVNNHMIAGSECRIHQNTDAISLSVNQLPMEANHA